MTLVSFLSLIALNKFFTLLTICVLVLSSIYTKCSFFFFIGMHISVIQCDIGFLCRVSVVYWLPLNRLLKLTHPNFLKKREALVYWNFLKRIFFQSSRIYLYSFAFSLRHWIYCWSEHIFTGCVFSFFFLLLKKLYTKDYFIHASESYL